MYAIRSYYVGVWLVAGAAAALTGEEAASKATEPKPVTLTVDQAVDLALENNIQLTSAGIDLRMKKRDADFAWNSFLPSVQATGTLFRSNLGEMTVTTLAGPMKVELEEKDRWRAMAGLSATLNLNLALFDGLKATRQGYEAGEISWLQAKQQTAQNVKKAFYGILIQEEALRLAKEKLATSEERLRQAQTNFRNGLVPELAYLQAQLSYNFV